MSSAIRSLAFAIGGTLIFSLSVHAEPPVAPFYQLVASLAPTGKLGEVIKREKVSTSIKGAQNGEFLPPLLPGSNPIQFRNCTRGLMPACSQFTSRRKTS